MSFVGDALGVLGKVAPTIATMIGGPFAGAAVTAIETALGLDPTGDKDAALKAVAQASPEQLLALKAEDHRHAEAMDKLGLDREALAVQDRNSARARAQAMNDKSPVWIGALILVVWATINGYLLITPYPPVIAPELTGRILGMIDAATMAFLYWIYGGSSTGDRLAAKPG